MSVTITPDGTPSLADVLWDPAPNETYLLVGDFPAVKGGPQTPATEPWTLDATEATFSGLLYTYNLHHLTFIGGTFAPEAGFRIDAINDVTIRGTAFTGSGIVIVKGTGLTVTQCSFDHCGCAVSVQGTDGVTITDNVVTNKVGDSFDAPGCCNVTVSRNRDTGASANEGAHPDFLQAWTYAGALPMTGWLVEDNHVVGLTQGIFVPDGVIGFARRNYLEVGFVNGMAVGNGTKLTVEDNTLKTFPGGFGQPGFSVFTGGEYFNAGGNTIDGEPYTGGSPVEPSPDDEIADLEARLEKISRLAIGILALTTEVIEIALG
jgi:hypothetical protein